MSYAFDPVAFARHWISLITKCLSIVHYYVILDGFPHGDNIPSRGIRQGDALSPFLFIVGARALSILLSKAKQVGALHFSRNNLAISYLLFVEYLIIFSKATIVGASTIKSIMEFYSLQANQLICKNPFFV